MSEQQTAKTQAEQMAVGFEELVKEAGEFRGLASFGKEAGTDDAGATSTHPSATEQAANTDMATEGDYSAEKQQDVETEQGNLAASKDNQPKAPELTDLETRPPAAAAVGEQPEIEKDIDSKGQDPGTSMPARADTVPYGDGKIASDDEALAAINEVNALQVALYKEATESIKAAEAPQGMDKAKAGKSDAQREAEMDRDGNHDKKDNPPGNSTPPKPSLFSEPSGKAAYEGGQEGDDSQPNEQLQKVANEYLPWAQQGFMAASQVIQGEAEKAAGEIQGAEMADLTIDALAKEAQQYQAKPKPKPKPKAQAKPKKAGEMADLLGGEGGPAMEAGMGEGEEEAAMEDTPIDPETIMALLASVGLTPEQVEAAMAESAGGEGEGEMDEADLAGEEATSGMTA